MSRLLYTGLVVVALVSGGFLFKAIFGMSLSNTSSPRALFERGAFELFEHENVQIYVRLTQSVLQPPFDSAGEQDRG